MGPLLFAVVLNSLSPLYVNTSVVAYADDLTIIRPSDPAGESYMQREVDNLVEWCTSRGLFINTDKTVHLPVSRSPITDESEIHVQGTKINSVSCTKILGIWFDQNLKWKNPNPFCFEEMCNVNASYQELSPEWMHRQATDSCIQCIRAMPCFICLACFPRLHAERKKILINYEKKCFALWYTKSQNERYYEQNMYQTHA